MVHQASTHGAPYECITCGAPEWSATSSSGCSRCGSQDEIVPAGTRARRSEAAREEREAEQQARNAADEAIQTSIAAATEDAPFQLLYWDRYDDSSVTATFGGKAVRLRRDDGRPMWSNGSNECPLGRWQSLVAAGYFIPLGE